MLRFVKINDYIDDFHAYLRVKSNWISKALEKQYDVKWAEKLVSSQWEKEKCGWDCAPFEAALKEYDWIWTWNCINHKNWPCFWGDSEAFGIVYVLYYMTIKHLYDGFFPPGSSLFALIFPWTFTLSTILYVLI